MSTDRSKGNKRSISNSRAKRNSKETKDNGRKGFSILKAFLMVLFMFISPIVVFIGLFKPRKPVPRKWVVSLTCLLTLCIGMTWTVSALVDNLSKNALTVLGNYSNYQVDVKDVPLAKQINYAALNNDLDPVLVTAIISQQSGFEAEKVSFGGAKGIMQITSNVWQEMNPEFECDGNHAAPACSAECIFDLEQNLDTGCRYLRYLINAYEGDVMLAVAAYSSGMKVTIPKFETDVVPLTQLDGQEVAQQEAEDVIIMPDSLEQGYTQGIIQSWINNRSKTLESRISLVLMARTGRTIMSVITVILAFILLLWSIFKYNRQQGILNEADVTESDNVKYSEDHSTTDLR